MKYITNFRSFLWILVLYGGIGLYGQAESVIPKDSLLLLETYKQASKATPYFKMIDRMIYGMADSDSSVDLDHLEEALAWRPDVLTRKDSLSVRYSYTSMAFHYMKRRGDYLSALDYFLVAHTYLTDKHNGDDLSWWIENEIGNIYTRLGDYDLAEYYLTIVERSLYKRGLTQRLSRLMTNKGRMYSSMNANDKAVNAFEKGLELVKEGDEGFFSNHMNLTELYLANDQSGKAQEHLDLLMTYSSHFDTERKMQYVEAKADLAALKGHNREADALYAEVSGIYMASGKSIYRREYAKLLNKQAINLISGNRYAEADSVISLGFHCLNRNISPSSRAIPDSMQVYGENTFEELLLTKATLIDRSRRDRIESDANILLKAYSTAVYVNDMLRKRYVMNPSHLYSLQANRKVLERMLDIIHDKKGYGDADYEILEDIFRRSKSVLLNERNQRQQALDQLDELQKQQYDDWSKRLFLAYGQMQNARKDSLINELRSLIVLTEDSLSQLESTLVMAPTEALIDYRYIDYFVGDQSVYSLSSTGKGLAFSRHGSADSLNNMLVRFNRYIENRFDNEAEVVRQLHGFLLEAIYLESGSVRILPDGPLLTLPFEVLLYNDTASYNLIEYAYNHSFSNRDTPEREFRMICVAPEYTARSGHNQLAELSRGDIYNLPYARKEIEEIAALVPELYEVNFDTLYDLMDMVDGFNIFHYAGHAIADGASAYLQLSSDDESRLYSKQIEALDLELDLVCLSACETGLGQLAKGEGILSLGRSFMSAGADAVLYSLWTVNDASTSELISYFYEYLLGGYRKSEALDKAKQKFRRRVPPERRHPYYWAGFVVVGNDRPIVNRRFNNWLVFMLPIILLVMAQFFKSTKQK